MTDSPKSDSELQVLRRMAANMVVWAHEMDNASNDTGAHPRERDQLVIMSGCVKTLLDEYTTFVKQTTKG